MNILRSIVAELISLFVDDGLFAVAIVFWVILDAVVAPAFGVSTYWRGIIFFAGLAVVLIESVARRSRSS